MDAGGGAPAGEGDAQVGGAPPALPAGARPLALLCLRCATLLRVCHLSLSAAASSVRRRVLAALCARALAPAGKADVPDALSAPPLLPPLLPSAPAELVRVPRRRDRVRLGRQGARHRRYWPLPTQPADRHLSRRFPPCPFVRPCSHPASPPTPPPPPSLRSRAARTSARTSSPSRSPSPSATTSRRRPR